jgi:hypothetical protein
VGLLDDLIPIALTITEYSDARRESREIDASPRLPSEAAANQGSLKSIACGLSITANRDGDPCPSGDRGHANVRHKRE